MPNQTFGHLYYLSFWQRLASDASHQDLVFSQVGHKEMLKRMLKGGMVFCPCTQQMHLSASSSANRSQNAHSPNALPFLPHEKMSLNILFQKALSKKEFNLVQRVMLYIIVVLDRNSMKEFEKFQAGHLDKRVD